MDLEEYKRTFSSEDGTPGWDAIDERLDALYGEQEPKHYAAPLPYALGGSEPLNGISVYTSSSGGKAHFHYVTYGFSELFYDEEAVGADFSKFGFELTFRLTATPEEKDPPSWPIGLLQNIAKYVFGSGNYFEAFHYMPANGPIMLGSDTDITALAFRVDPELGVMQTPHGEVQFLQACGITTAEYETLKASKGTAEALVGSLAAADPMLITDLARRS
jgi:hypothetical protein